MLCPQCLPLSVHSAALPLASVQLQDTNKYSMTCNEGHRSTFVLQNQRFELLYETGAQAIIDGYYREAISSFAAALERAYEFFSTACMIQRGCSWDALDSAKKLNHLSERELGAFITLYTLEIGSAPELLHRNLVELRNKVVHQGRIPTRAEALKFGEAVLVIIRRLIAVVKDRFPDGLESVTWRHLLSAPREEGDTSPTTTCLATIVSLVTKYEDDPPTLQQSLEVLSRWRLVTH
jgi:hypothetical protein